MTLRVVFSLPLRQTEGFLRHCHVNRVGPQRPAWIPFQAVALAVSQASLSEVAFKLRREVTPKVSALKAAIKAERETFRLKRKLQQLDIKNLEQAEERESLPEVHRGGREP